MPLYSLFRTRLLSRLLSVAMRPNTIEVVQLTIIFIEFYRESSFFVAVRTAQIQTAAKNQNGTALVGVAAAIERRGSPHGARDVRVAAAPLLLVTVCTPSTPSTPSSSSSSYLADPLPRAPATPRASRTTASHSAPPATPGTSDDTHRAAAERNQAGNMHVFSYKK